MDIEWAKSLRDQVKKAGIPYYFKQIGGHPNPKNQWTDFPFGLQIQEIPEWNRKILQRSFLD